MVHARLAFNDLTIPTMNVRLFITVISFMNVSEDVFNSFLK